MGKSFVEVNWTSGFDEKGRPLRVPDNIGTTSSPILPLVATNWFPPSYSAETGLFYIPAWERPILRRPSPGYGALRAFDPRTGDYRHLSELEPHLPKNRSNDGAPDAKGRFWIGTMQNNLGPGGAGIPIKAASGSLWRVEPGKPPVAVLGVRLTRVIDGGKTRIDPVTFV